MGYYTLKKTIYGLLRRELDKDPELRVAALAGEDEAGIARIERGYKRYMDAYEHNLRASQRGNQQVWDFLQASTLIDPKYFNKRANEAGAKQVRRLLSLYEEGFEVFVGVVNFPAPKNQLGWRDSDIASMANIVCFDRQANKKLLNALVKAFPKGEVYVLRQEELTLGFTTFPLRELGNVAGAKVNFHVNYIIAIRKTALPKSDDLDVFISELVWNLAKKIVIKLRCEWPGGALWIDGDEPLAKPDVKGGAGPFRFSKIQAQSKNGLEAALRAWAQLYPQDHPVVEYDKQRVGCRGYTVAIKKAVHETSGGTWKHGRISEIGRKTRSFTPFQIVAEYRRAKNLRGALAKAFLFFTWVVHTGRTMENSRGIKFSRNIDGGAVAREWTEEENLRYERAQNARALANLNKGRSRSVSDRARLIANGLLLTQNGFIVSKQGRAIKNEDELRTAEEVHLLFQKVLDWNSKISEDELEKLNAWGFSWDGKIMGGKGFVLQHPVLQFGLYPLTDLTSLRRYRLEHERGRISKELWQKCLCVQKAEGVGFRSDFLESLWTTLICERRRAKFIEANLGAREVDYSVLPMQLT